jgi:signal transduction histidine kinase
MATGSQTSSWGNGRRLALFFVLLGASAGLSADTNGVLSRIVTVRVGGLMVQGPWSTNTSGVMSLTVPKPARIEISYEPIASTSNQPIRLLRILEGTETEWQEAGGQMQRNAMELVVIIHGAANEILSYRTFSMTGESEGWQGDAANSKFQPRRRSIFLPPGAEGMQVLLTAENWSVVGSAAITDFRVLRPDANGREVNLWPDPNIEEGENLDQPDGIPRYWQRSGVGKPMAQVIKLPPPATGHALVIKDDDVRLSAAWQADVPLGGQTHAGDNLALGWQEAYSVGNGGRSRATFEPLPRGKYVFRVKTVTPFGEPIGSELALTILIPQPLWKHPAFIGSVILISAAAIAALVWFIAHRRMQIRLNQLEYRRKMEHERFRIARDIHDDLGATLTQISLLSQAAHGKLASSNPAWQDTERLRTVAVMLTQKLDEIVWAVSPQHDTFESLLSYLTDFAEEFLEAAGIRARIHIPAEQPDWVVPSSLRHNFFLAAKEALNNAVKHAGATEVRLQVSIKECAFELTVQDNGGGFSPPPPAPGNKPTGRHGLDGMRSRMESIGGDFNLDTAPGQGTRVTFTVPVATGPS